MVEDYKLIDDAQEGFRFTKRQLSELHCILSGQRRRKTNLFASVLLYLDIKNAFDAVNHRAIFIDQEAFDFPAAEINLICRMYFGSFLSTSNLFEETAACFLARRFAQGTLLVRGFLKWHETRSKH